MSHQLSRRQILALCSTRQNFPNCAMASPKFTPDCAQRDTSCGHFSHGGFSLFRVLSGFRLFSRCMKATFNCVLSILIIRYPLKVFNSIVSFAPIYVVNLGKVKWVFNKGYGHQPMHLKYLSAKIDSAVALLRLLVKSILFGGLGAHQFFTSKSRAISAAGAPDISHGTDFVFCRESRNLYPSFFSHSADSIREHLQNITINSGRIFA